MTNLLTKNIGIEQLSPAIPGTPGVTAQPAYCVTTSTTTPGYTTQLIQGPPLLGQTEPTYAWVTVATTPVTTTSTVCYPAIAGVAPVPGVPAKLEQQFNLGWNAGARSIGAMLAQGTATFSVGDSNVGAVVGLYAGAPTYAFAEATHALYFRKGLVSVLELGAAQSGAVPYTAADVFRIERSGSTVRYYKNTTLLHTSAAPSYGTQYLEASLYSGGDTVLNASMTDVTTVGYGSGTAVLAPLAARGGIAGSSGNAVLAPLTSAGTGYVQQGGAAVLAPVGAIGSQGSYAMGTATLAPLGGLGEAGIAGSAPAYALGVAVLTAVGSAGYGVTAGNTISPATSLGDNASGWPEHVWVGSVVVIVSGAGAGQTREIADNSGQALLINTPWVTVPNATSVYEIRDALGNVLTTGTVTPGGGAMRPLAALGSNYAYAGGDAVLAPVKSYGTYVTPLKGWAFIGAPMATLVAVAHDSTGENAANITAPKATLSVYLGMGAKPKAPIAKLVASGTTQNWLTSDIAGPAGRLVATATVSGTSQLSATAPTATLVGYGGMVCSATLTGRATLQSSATGGAISAADITGPMATLDLFEVRTEAFSTANIIAPAGQMGATLQAWVLAPMATLTAIGTATITASFEAYAVNLNHPPAARGNEQPVDETTRYTNFPFTHVVRYRNSYYGANSTGLYLLEGTTDDGEDIPYTLRTAISDFKSPFRKTVASAYFGGRLGPDATMTLYAGEGAQTQAYSYTTPRGALAQNYRQAFGKGIRQHRFYAVGISGEDALALDSLELDTHNSTRRI